MHKFAFPLIIGLTAATAWAGQAIEDLAPRSSFAVFGLKSIAETKEHLKATPLWDLLQTEPITELRQEFYTQFEHEFKGMCEELDIESNGFTCPDGGMGFAIFLNRDPDTGMPFPGVLGFADWGHDADKIEELINSMVAHAQEEDENFEYEAIELQGRSGYRFAVPHEIHEVDTDDDYDMQMGGMMDAPQEMLQSIDSVYFVRDENTFYLCTDQPSLTAALGIIDGEEGHATISQHANYQAIMNQVGDGDAYGVFLMDGAMQLVSGVGGGMAMMFIPMLQQFIGDIQGGGMSMRIDGEKAMVEQSFSLYMPNGKAGLSRLLAVESPRPAVPTFVSADSVSYWHLNFQFEGLPMLIKQVRQIIGPMMGMGQGGQTADDQSTDLLIQQLLTPLGPEMHGATKIAHPIGVGSMKQCTAVKCSDTENFDKALGQFGAGWGLMGEEVYGRKLYTLDLSGMMGMMPMQAGPGMGIGDETMSVGIDKDYVYAGHTSVVTQAMSHNKMATLSSTKDFQYAMSVLSDEPILGWGYTDIVTTMEAQAEISKLAMEQMIQQMRDFDPEFQDEDIETMMNMGIFSKFQEFDWDMLREYIGPGVWECHVVDDGFICHSYSLAPAE